MHSIHTFWKKRLQFLIQIDSRDILHRLEPFIVGDVHVGPEIMGRETQLDDQTLVPEYRLVIAEDGVREFRLEGGDALQFAITGLHNGDIDGVVRPAGP